MKIKFNTIVIQEASSTNLFMQEWKKAGKLKNGDVLRAVNQNNGIGQHGNFWESEAGKNLTFSLFLETHFIPASDVFLLNKIISVALYDYLKSSGLPQVTIKWPNDLFVGDKKIAGMLTHNSFLGDKLENSIIGIGMNINQMEFITDAPNPISMKQITGIDYDLEKELDSILNYIEKELEQFNYYNRKQLNAKYLRFLYGFGESRQFKDSEGSFIGVIKSVDSFGRLLIKKEKGLQSVYDIKEIQFL